MNARTRITNAIRRSGQADNPQALGWEIARVLIDDFDQNDLDEWDVASVISANPNISPEALADVILAELELDALT